MNTFAGPSDTEVQRIKQRVLAAPVFRSADVWMPVDARLIVTGTTLSASVAETTIPLADAAERLVVPARTAAVQYRVELVQNAGTGSVAVIAQHRPGGDTVVEAITAGAGSAASSTGLVDVNGARLTYTIDVAGSATFSFNIYANAFVRVP